MNAPAYQMGKNELLAIMESNREIMIDMNRHTEHQDNQALQLQSLDRELGERKSTLDGLQANILDQDNVNSELQQQVDARKAEIKQSEENLKKENEALDAAVLIETGEVQRLENQRMAEVIELNHKLKMEQTKTKAARDRLVETFDSKLTLSGPHTQPAPASSKVAAPSRRSSVSSHDGSSIMSRVSLPRPVEGLVKADDVTYAKRAAPSPTHLSQRSSQRASQSPADSSSTKRAKKIDDPSEAFDSDDMTSVSLFLAFYDLAEP